MYIEKIQHKMPREFRHRRRPKERLAGTHRAKRGDAVSLLCAHVQWSPDSLRPASTHERVEGYEGLVFHGPLTATLLAGLAESATSRQLETFSFRGAAPLFDTEPFRLGGVATDSGADFWAETPDHGVSMTATATFR